MTTYTWAGGIGGDWFTAANWVTGTAFPTTGASVLINAGTVDLSGAEEIATVPDFGQELTPVNGEQITLGSTVVATPAEIVATAALFGQTVSLTSTGTNAYATLDAVGPTGFQGTITASAPGGIFNINATQAFGTQAADFVMLNGGHISVSGGDDLVLDGLIDLETSVTIAAGSTITNDGTVSLFAGTDSLLASSILNGTGTFIVGPDDTMVLDAPVPSTQTIQFDGPGRINLGDVAAFAGQITDFTQGSTIDLLGTIANYASFNSSTGILTIENAGSNATTPIATLQLQGPASGMFNTGTDGTGGTIIDLPGNSSRITYEIDTADQAVGANIVRSTMTTAAGVPITGAGITIGIMSDSFNATITTASTGSITVNPEGTAITDGFLPADGADILQDYSSGSDEGLAMAELVHQIAPGAQIDFSTAEGGQDGFANSVNALVEAGANIIVDDFSYNTSPFFQVAGPIDTAVSNAIADGVDYFTAAGNYGQAYFQAAWNPTTAQIVERSGQSAQTVSAQEFDNGTNFQTITVPGSITTAIELQWNVAWPSSGGSVPDSLGMALYNMSGSIVASSFQESGSPDYSGIPESILDVPQSTTSQQYQLAIYQIPGAAAVSEFKYILSGSPTSAVDPGGTIDDPEAGIGSGDIKGQGLVPGVNTVGASYWANSPAYDVAPDWREYFADSGPGELLFNGSGTPVDQIESEPEFIAPDGIETSVPGFQTFGGTSAAAPDAAAVAALMMQANPDLTTADITAMLEASAVSMGLPAADQGAGLVQAPRAVQLALDALARTLVWTGAVGTSFTTAANWNDITSDLNPALSGPGETDTAEFLTGGGTIDGTGTAAALEFGGLAQWTLGASSALTAAGTAGVTVGAGGADFLSLSSGATIISQGATDTISGASEQAAGVTVGGIEATWKSAGELVVGGAGLGSLAIQAAGTVTAGGLAIANTVSADGSSVNLSEAGSNLRVSGLLDVGVDGFGALSISDGALVTAGTLDAGNVASAVANISVSDADFTVSGSATVADDGTGVMSVLSGATFAAASLTIGSQGDSSGALVVSGDGSVVTVSGDLNVGTAAGTGDLTIGPGATVNALVVNLQGEVVLENGELDPTVNLINQGQTAGGSGTIAAGDIVDEGVIQAGGSKPSQKLLVVAGTILGGGPWTINGTAQPRANGDVGVLQINAGGTLELTGPVLNAAATTFTDDVTPQSTYTVNDSVVEVNFEDAAGILKLDDIAGFAGTIALFRAGDEFVVSGGVLSNLGVSNNNTLTVSDSGNGGSDQIIFGSPISAAGFSIVNNNTIQVACFAAGTRIATETGPVAVEELRIGDRVITVSGHASTKVEHSPAEPIVWLGQRTVNCELHPKPETVWPVRISAGAFGDNVPVRDLYLSPDHAVFVNDVLIPVKRLVNGTGIAQSRRDRVTYYHVELPEHAVILAERLPVESYLDLGDRANFDRGYETIRLFPDFAARLAPDAAMMWETRAVAPLVTTGEGLSAARQTVSRSAPRRLRYQSPLKTGLRFSRNAFTASR
jgi:T5SS/PEP-CTERM-associated repeat protein